MITLKEGIKLKGIVFEDFVNYSKPSITIMFPQCSFKCEGCQNASLTSQPDISTTVTNIYRKYRDNPITEAVVCQGLEPFDSWEELYSLLFQFRIHEACLDDFVIYTGYNKDEIPDKIETIQRMFSNVIVKFGRYLPGHEPHYDKVLGVKLASDNQYAERIS